VGAAGAYSPIDGWYVIDLICQESGDFIAVAARLRSCCGRPSVAGAIGRTIPALCGVVRSLVACALDRLWRAVNVSDRHDT
jgi:hypothetical protein